MNVIQIMNEDCESGEKEVLGVGISVYSQRMRIAWLQEGSKEALRFLPSARSERRTVTLWRLLPTILPVGRFKFLM